MKSIVVTGASTGIGLASVKTLLARGFRVFGSVRKQADGARLRSELGAHFTPLIFDVTDAEAVARGAAEVAAALDGETLAGLVNNAGIAVPGALLILAPQDLKRQLDVNVVSAMIVTQAFAPLLGTDKGRKGLPGRIVMMSSVGGTSATPFMGAYNASKFALEGFSEALRRELMLFGIDVIIVAPGQVKTPIWGKAEAMDWTGYENTPYARPIKKMLEWVEYGDKSGLPPEAIGAAVAKALTTAHPKTRYVLTPSPVQHFAMNHLPKRWVDRIMARMLGLTKPKP